MLFFLNSVNAQSHKVGQANYNCKLNKKGWFFNSEKLPCPACEVTEKKEKAAKAAEDKRRSDVTVAKANADKLAKDAAYKKTQAELAEKNKVTEVAVTMPKSTVVNSNNQVKRGIVNSTDKAILKRNGSGRGFTNEKGEILFEKDEWDTAYTIEGLSMTKNCIKNFGIVDVRTGKKGNKFGEFRADVINSKGEYLFNDENIRFICHINDGWLLVGSWNSNNYYVYNLIKKVKINFTSISEYGFEYGRMVWGPASDLFVPIFSNDIVENDIYSYQLQGKFSNSFLLKKHLKRLFPQELNEDFLSKQSFVFVHTNYFASDLIRTDYYKFEEYYNSTSILLLHCISKDGKLNTIKLK